MLALLAILFFATDTPAATAGFNPYSGIVERNSFGLRAPVNPADLVKPPPPLVADIKLQGITTILGRNQVLMKIHVPAKPPEPARDQSVVLSEGQREGEVEVLEINPAAGTVKINNAGTILPLNMVDNGEKPTPGAAVPAVSSPVPGVRLPGVPPPAPAMNRVGNPGGASVTAFGGAAQNVSTFGGTTDGAPTQKTIPTRTLRTSTTAGGAGNPGGAAAGGEFQNISPEAQAILIEAQRAQLTPGGFDPLPKTVITPSQHR